MTAAARARHVAHYRAGWWWGWFCGCVAGALGALGLVVAGLHAAGSSVSSIQEVSAMLHPSTPATGPALSPLYDSECSADPERDAIVAGAALRILEARQIAADPCLRVATNALIARDRAVVEAAAGQGRAQ